MAAGVTFESINKQFGAVHAVKELTLTADEGEFLVLVGPSGCGKTTALRMVAGLEEPTSGQISIAGRDVTFASPSDRDIAMVFQSYALYPHMSVRQNLAFGLQQRRTPRAEIAERVREASRMLAIEHLLDRRPRELSGGQRQRVALGRAIVRRPSVFLMDEPLSNLDAQLRMHTRAELAELHRTLATTIIYVTHDQVEAMTLGTRIAVMKDGELQQLATPQLLYESPANAFVASFIGSPPMNLLPGLVTTHGEGLAFAISDQRIPLPPHLAARAMGYAEVTLGLRPEHFARRPATGSGDGLNGTIRIVEPIGSDTFAGIDIGGAVVTARLDPESAPAIGDHVRLIPDMERASLFLAADGRRL